MARHYPNDLLISGFDIRFFWDARMAMQGMHFMGDVPWKRLYLHGLVRAADGQKMSKSKGNVVDPLGLIDKYGADALRFFMAAMESQGRDVKMDESRVEGYRNFATKLWNATRFCQANGIGASASVAAPAATSAVNKWIIGEVVETLATLDKAMAELRFDAAANAIYQFAWGTFCDWYLELIKGQIDDETKGVAGWVLDQILVMLHPFMPFITEELWHAQGDRPYELILASWPKPEAAVDVAAKAEVEWLIGLVREVRGIKAALDANSKRAGIAINILEEPQRSWLRDNILAFHRMVRAENIYIRDASDLSYWQEGAETFGVPVRALADMAGAGEVQLVFSGLEARLNFFGDVDIGAAQARLTKARETSAKERDSLAKRLENPAFVEKAKPEAVEKARADHAHHTAEVERLEAALARLG